MDETKTNVESISRNLDSHFAIGQILDVQIKDKNETRFQARLVGLKSKKFLLVDQPARIRNIDIKEVLPNGQQVVVRTIAEKTSGKCVGFMSRVHFKQEIPVALMYLNFPEQMQVMDLRREKRIQLNVEGKIKDANGKVINIGWVTDYSQGGCRIEISNAYSQGLEINSEVFIAFILPLTGEDIEKKARVCSRRKVEDNQVVGFEFL